MKEKAGVDSATIESHFLIRLPEKEPFFSFNREL